MMTDNVVETVVKYECGLTRTFKGYAPPGRCKGGCAPISVERKVKTTPGVDVTGTNPKDAVTLKEGSLEQAAVEVALADGLPVKLEAAAKLSGGSALTSYELDLLAKGIALVKADALTRIAKANKPSTTPTYSFSRSRDFLLSPNLFRFP